MITYFAVAYSKQTGLAEKWVDLSSMKIRLINSMIGAKRTPHGSFPIRHKEILAAALGAAAGISEQDLENYDWFIEPVQ